MGAETKPKPADWVMLADLEDLYEPVPFDHRGHADMAEMSSGCVVCHHYTPQGQEHPACRSCHPQGAVHGGTRMPGLKGAYHRQCLSCHRDWSHETACNACHVPKTKREVPAQPAPQPQVSKALARMGPAITLEDTYVYQTRQAPLPVVTFHHGDHAKAFGLQCVECHRGDTCGRCHDSERARTQAVARAPTPSRTNACFTCHQETNCGFCHDSGRRPSFDHATKAGWPLQPHHANVACGECHGPADEFVVPSKVCHACHVRPPDPGALHLRTSASAGHSQDGAKCLLCHEDMSARIALASSVHGPVGDPSGCNTCHDVGGVQSPRPSRAGRRELCLSCHDRPIDVGGGWPLADIAALLAQNPNHHGPVRDGECNACHDPHASDYARLLVREYAPGFYAPFALGAYELCFGCHDAGRVLSEARAGLTGFRDGDRNLHKLHVNQEKGRTCRVCHEIHASCKPFHIRESVPYGESTWMLPINYERTADGGGCAPGCHSAQAYCRDLGARAQGGNGR